MPNILSYISAWYINKIHTFKFHDLCGIKMKQIVSSWIKKPYVNAKPNEVCYSDILGCVFSAAMHAAR